MPPHDQQLDPTAIAWLQLLQSQVPAQHDPDVGSSSRVQANAQEYPERPSSQPTHLSGDPADPEEEDDSGAEQAAVAEDKRRRNTAASGNLTVPSLSYQLIQPHSPIPEQEEAVGVEYGANRYKPNA